MKIFKLMMIALVAMLGFIACDKHECNDYDHSADLVGTWTCLQKDFAEALIIKADGSVVSTGVAFGEYWENVKGNIVVENGNATMTFEDGDKYEGHFDIIPGMAFSICNDMDRRFTYNYCKEDLSDEIVGMWVCNDGLAEEENDMVIMTYSTEGKVTMTTPASTFVHTDFVNQVFDYKVVGDLLFKLFPKENLPEGANPYLVSRVTYTPNGTSLGDVLIENQHTPTENGVMELTFSFLRVKQSLDLAGKNYDYSNIYLSNVKGLDKDIEFMGYTMNFATLDGTGLNKMLKTILFNIQFPDADTMRYSGYYNGVEQFYNAPINVDGNKVTIKMSEKISTLKDVVFYAFQDADDCQLHLYMHKTAFVNFYTNVQARLMANMDPQFDITNAESINAIYNSINNAVETINLSLVMAESTKAL